MPNAATHSVITRAALDLQPFPVKENTALIADYCNYPDRAECCDYDLITDGVSFHYLPDVSLNELYRYWLRENGRLKHRVPFVNEHFEHCYNGFTHYISRTVEYFRRKENEEARKYLGWLLHVLEDGVFGLHALEGFLGSDPFILDRLTGNNVSDILAAIALKEALPIPEYTPRLLGCSIAESVMLLYAGFCRYSADSRQCCYRYAVDKLAGKDAEAELEVKKMFENAVKLCADVIFTVFMLAENSELSGREYLKLTELEPYEFPFGGCNGYRYRRYSIDCALDNDHVPIPLKIGSRVYADGIAFAAHHEGALRYRMGQGVFRHFSCAIGLHPDLSMEKDVILDIINDGKIIDKIVLNKEHSEEGLFITDPVNDFGIAFHCSPTSGEVVVIGEPRLYR
ncbi:MAG: hypothetical protein E7057_00025 [Lentisphaerae bacterium]|nr:hypothetical protein [Lentisphaerota bacterium]